MALLAYQRNQNADKRGCQYGSQRLVADPGDILEPLRHRSRQHDYSQARGIIAEHLASYRESERDCKGSDESREQAQEPDAGAKRIFRKHPVREDVEEVGQWRLLGLIQVQGRLRRQMLPDWRQ